MRVGIICEGSTDFAVIEALALNLLPADECVQLHPDFDRLQATSDPAHAPGWQGVRKFLQTSGPALSLPIYDVIVIQVDASIRKLKELHLPRMDDGGLEPLDALYEHVVSWAVDGLPASAIITLPREELEAWLIAAHTHAKNVETLEDPAFELASRGLIGMKKGKPDKDAEVYRKLAIPLVRLARNTRKVRDVPELERFVGRLRTRAREVRQSRR